MRNPFKMKTTPPRKIRIIRAVITDSKSRQTINYNDMIIENSGIEQFRSSIKTEPKASVLLTYEEIEL